MGGALIGAAFLPAPSFFFQRLLAGGQVEGVQVAVSAADVDGAAGDHGCAFDAVLDGHFPDDVEFVGQFGLVGDAGLERAAAELGPVGRREERGGDGREQAGHGSDLVGRGTRAAEEIVGVNS